MIMGFSPKKDEAMSSVDFARSAVRQLADGEDRKNSIPRLARLLNWTPRRVRAAFDGEAKRFSWEEIEDLRAAKAHAAEHALTKKAPFYAQDLDDHAARLEQIDPDFYRADIDRYRDLARRARGLAR